MDRVRVSGDVRAVTQLMERVPSSSNKSPCSHDALRQQGIFPG